ncbi:MAG TPA: uroporphyrinogen-III C-methyltransferase [Opitutaceae bacterium]|nr:uroporphyrinogen-III C-methyltransferase [Opitutaceae bacterium]
MVQENTINAPGFVSIVGAGPGAVDLITLRGRAALEEAQVVIHDALANLDLLHFCQPGVEVRDVGKRCNSHRVTQEQIHESMIASARAGKRVVRLKGGDPSVFARLFEETAALEAAGVPFEIIPGVTAACATAATLGVSLTSRDLAPGAVFVTGHECANRAAANPVDWVALAKLNMTLCVYMGVRELPSIAGKLLAAGMAPDTPLTVVSNASRPNESVRTGLLADAAAFAVEDIGQPAMIFIGAVVGAAKNPSVALVEPSSAGL